MVDETAALDRFASAGVLGGLAVLELGDGVPGAFCGKLLAGLGADVLLLEPPEGASLRGTGPFKADRPDPETSGVFLYLNTAKRSATLDLGEAADRESFRRLAERADVLIESLAPGVLDRRGLGFTALSAANPGLIMASITPFGQDGPYRDFQTDELVAEALGGLLYPIGLPERGPVKIGGSPALHAAGCAAFSAIMAALWQRDATGEGQFIDISIQETTALTQIHASIEATWLGTNLQRRESVLLPAADGWASVGLEMGVAAETWSRFCELLGRSELAADPRFATSAARRDNREALLAIVEGWVRGRPQEEVYHILQSLRSIAGYVATPADLYRSAQLEARGFFHRLDHPVAGPALYPGAPFKIGVSEWVHGRAPLLGEQNGEVLG